MNQRLILALCLALCGIQAHPQSRLATSDAAITLAAGATAPQLLTLSAPGQTTWRNQAPETLPTYVIQKGRHLPLAWHRVPALDRITPHSAVFVYESQQPHLRLFWQWTAPAPSGPIEHGIVIRNLTSSDYWLPFPDTLRLNWLLPAAAPLQHLYIDKGAGTPTPIGTHLDAFRPGDQWTGWSTTFAHPAPGQPDEIIPFEAVFNPQSGSQRSGWYAGVESSARLRLSLARTSTTLAAVLGLNPEPAPAVTRLIAGGRFTAPTVFLGAFTGGPDGLGNQLRPWVRAVLASRGTWADPHFPLVVNNSWGAGMTIDETIAHRMIADAASLGFEMFHLDAGWFRGVGDWYPNPRKFPHGLAALAADAHSHGLRFGLWTDWSQAALSTGPGTLNLRDPTVSSWLVAPVPPHWKPQDFKGQTIDIGVPAAHHWAARETNRIVTDYHLDMLEHDGYLVAQGCTRSGHPHAPPDPHHLTVDHYDGEDIVLSSNSTDVSYHAVQSYYDIQSHLRRLHPGLLLEICNDGGRMVDFGSAAHGDYFSITDSYDPLSNRQAFYDASHLLPPAMLETYVDKRSTPTLANFLYELRSGMMGWLSVMQNTNTWTPRQHAAARAAIAIYKSRLRPLIRDAQLFHISPRPDGLHWDGIEYFDPALRQGVVYAFRGSAPGDPTHTFRLAGINPAGTYRLHFNDGSSADTTASGSHLLATGLSVRLTQPFSSELIFFSQK